jgi:putative membrane protein insertion efficiency factor
MTARARAAMIGAVSMTPTPPARVASLVARALLFAIRMYRMALSPLVGPSCRYLPSCSHYAEEAIRTWGPLRGVGLAAWRIARCHPFCAGGLDPVPARGQRGTPTTLPLE